MTYVLEMTDVVLVSSIDSFVNTLKQLIYMRLNAILEFFISTELFSIAADNKSTFPSQLVS